MKIRILFLAYPLTAVGPDACGGTEQMLYRLLAGLNRPPWQGRVETYTVAREGNDVPGGFESWRQLCLRMGIALPPSIASDGREVKPEDLEAMERATNRAALALLQERTVDLVHNQGASFYRVAERWDHAAKPVLMTLHLARSLYPAGMLDRLPPNLFFQCVSRTQYRAWRQELPASGLAHLVGWIRNGIALDDFIPAADGRRGGYLLYAGRICPEKGPHLAIELARRTGRPLLLLGEVYRFPSHRAYFEREIQPHLGETVVWKPHTSLIERRTWMAGAAAVVIPSLVEETSSLVAMEAAASGTPVIAFRRGALAETVVHQRTGFLCDSIDEMERVVRRLSRIRSHDCRVWAESCFDADRMVREYVELYRRLVHTSARQRVPASAERPF